MTLSTGVEDILNWTADTTAARPASRDVKTRRSEFPRDNDNPYR